MLSELETEQIRSEIPRYPELRAMVPEALRIVQEHRGWISDESLRDVASLLSMSVEEVDSVATGYNMIFRRPVGRHVIMVCDNVSCWIMGSDAILTKLRERLDVAPGGTTADGRFTLLPSACLGDCHEAPVLLIDGDYHANVTPEGIDAVLESYP